VRQDAPGIDGARAFEVGGCVAERTIDDVLAGLDRVIDRSVATGDRRAYFAVLYRRVTAQVKEQIGTGFFDDPDRIARLDVLFADRYLDAVAAVDRGVQPTGSWALTFDAGRRRRPLILQHLLIGINAHINLDLGIAAARCSPGDQLADLRADYDRVNAILAAMVSAISTDLRRVSPWMGLLDVVGARTQSEVVRFSIVTARAGAWRFATELATTPESGWDPLIDDRDRRVAAVGERVLRPGPRIGAALLLARLRERQDLAANVELLLGVPAPSRAALDARVDDPTLTP
jgi:hypothetical protein